jgi:MinD superfamily P-loop ATPase
MKIAIASGKGGTGKTTVAASLVRLWDGPVWAVDLDVEEPNLHLFLKPEIAEHSKAYMPIPVVDETRCTYCGACSDICQFKAISVFSEVVMTFPEMCHGCGACMAVCPEDAVRAGQRELGEIHWGRAGTAGFVMGRLRVGEAMSPPLMRAVKEKLAAFDAASESDVIIDAPPGVSCPAVNAVMDADAIVLVTEPTPFGLYDLTLAHEAFSGLEKPMGVVINRAGLGDRRVYNYCQTSGLEILAEIPFDRRIAEAYAQGRIIADTSTVIRRLFTALMAAARRMNDPEIVRGEVDHA